MKLLLVIPVFNEEERLARNIAKLTSFCDANRSFKTEIVIVDNGSTDRTLEIASTLIGTLQQVRVMHLNQKGRGQALKTTWASSDADILTYMDVDLSTDLTAFPPMVAALSCGQFDIVAGSRLLPGSVIVRSWRREFISRGYNALVKRLFRTHFSDAQCGFKGITRAAAKRILPFIADTEWFFDTELLLVAEACGFRIFDLPVTWIDDPDSKVRILSTVWQDIKGMARIRRNLRSNAYEHLLPDPVEFSRSQSSASES